jgi:hypothetical protein
MRPTFAFALAGLAAAALAGAPAARPRAWRVMPGDSS